MIGTKMMRQFNDLIINNRGFSLIEMLMAVTIFAIIVGAISGLFISGIRSQRRVLATQEVLDQASYVMEYMSRGLRMAKKDLTGDCLTTAGAGYNYENPGGVDSKIRFLNFKGRCQQFSLISGRLEEIKSTNDSEAGFSQSRPYSLTSHDLQISSLTFELSGESQTDNLQPRVTIFLEAERLVAGSPLKIQIQTSISQRDIDVEI